MVVKGNAKANAHEQRAPIAAIVARFIVRRGKARAKRARAKAKLNLGSAKDKAMETLERRGPIGAAKAAGSPHRHVDGRRGQPAPDDGDVRGGGPICGADRPDKRLAPTELSARAAERRRSTVAAATVPPAAGAHGTSVTRVLKKRFTTQGVKVALRL